jgi:hypothetical protein
MSHAVSDMAQKVELIQPMVSTRGPPPFVLPHHGEDDGEGQCIALIIMR